MANDQVQKSSVTERIRPSSVLTAEAFFRRADSLHRRTHTPTMKGVPDLDIQLHCLFCPVQKCNGQ